MSLQLLIIVGRKTERVSQLIETLSEDMLVDCFFFETLTEAHPLLEPLLPDLILLLADSLEENRENVTEFTTGIRQQLSADSGMGYRTVIVVETNEDNKEKRIHYILCGADDILSGQLAVDELTIRLLAHLRRNLELLTHPVTRLAGFAIASRLLQRKIHQSTVKSPPSPRQGGTMAATAANPSQWAFMLIETDHFDVYHEVYGELATNQLLRTVAALLRKLAIPPDFAGHFDESDTFWMLTQPDRAEKIASILCRQFEAVLPNFYSEKDRKRGYIISIGHQDGYQQASRRVPLLSLSIGIINNQIQPYLSYKAAFFAASEMKFLAKRFPGNAWVSDRLKLTGSTKITRSTPHLLVVESDEALAYLLKTTLEMEHYQVTLTSSPEEALSCAANEKIHLVILDSLLHDQPIGWELCEQMKAISPKIKAIFVSTLHDREKALGAGADLYLPKPFELVSLFAWIERLLLIPVGD